MTDPRVVCIGLATEDTVLRVDRIPDADDRIVASEHVVAGGGPAATAAVTLARLGIPTAFIGTVGDDEVGERLRDGLASEGVDVTWLAEAPGARSPRSIVLVTYRGRAIASFPGTVPPPAVPADALEACAAAAWVHVDQLGYGASPPGSRLSIDGGNAIAGLQLAGVALYAPTERALCEQIGSAEDALTAGAELVVVTRGERGSVAYMRGGEVVEAPAEPVDTVSTLGAGDVFHGALLAQLVRGEALPEALAFANRCAALSCRALDGRSAIPRLEEAAA